MPLSIVPIATFTCNRQLLLQQTAQNFACIWLQDAGQEVIAFLPLWLINTSCTLSSPSSKICQKFTRELAPINYHESTLQGSFKDHVMQCWQNSMPEYVPAVALKNGFLGGLAGFIGYDTNTAALGFYDVFLRQDTPNCDSWTLYGVDNNSYLPLYEHIASLLTVTSVWHTSSTTHLTAIFTEVVTNQIAPELIKKPLRPLWAFDDYKQAYNRIQHYLRAGDCYQVNLTQPFLGEVSSDVLPLLFPLLTLTEAPYAGYFKYPQHGFLQNSEIISCSPELFLTFTAEGLVKTRPIKGTMPRFSDKEKDKNSALALAMSTKDRSENLMIVDLLRNDLSKYAQLGSVQTPILFEVESFKQVHHLVSEIHAQLQERHLSLELLFDALPGGSITGAPKHRAMQIIAELEPCARGAYCGSMGYLNIDGSGQFNILIRTLERVGQQLSAWAGGGITIASQLDNEYQECFHKIDAILSCVNSYYHLKP